VTLRPVNDWLLVELEPEVKETSSGLILVAPEPIRSGRVLRVGPGKRYPEKFVETVVRVGERVAFFIAGAQTKQGTQLSYVLPENQILIRETDVLLVLDGDMRVTR
jgi:co-chaperonin GroES (HSP10)